MGVGAAMVTALFVVYDLESSLAPEDGAILSSLILCGLVVLGLLALLWQSEGGVRVACLKSEAALGGWVEEVRGLVSRSLVPCVSLVRGRFDVAAAAAKVVLNAHKQAEAAKRFISLHGASSMSTPDGELTAHGTTGDYGEHLAHQDYEGALEAAASDRIAMTRYVRLFEKAELAGRSSRVQREYLNWLRVQLNFMERNENFELISSARAPEWQSGAARIYSWEWLVEVTGKGEAALVLRDPVAIDLLRRYSEEEMEKAAEKRRYGKLHEEGGRGESFRKYVEEVEDMVRASAGLG